MKMVRTPMPPRGTDTTRLAAKRRNATTAALRHLRQIPVPQMANKAASAKPARPPVEARTAMIVPRIATKNAAQ